MAFCRPTAKSKLNIPPYAGDPAPPAPVGTHPRPPRLGPLLVGGIAALRRWFQRFPQSRLMLVLANHNRFVSRRGPPSSTGFVFSPLSIILVHRVFAGKRPIGQICLGPKRG